MNEITDDYSRPLPGAIGNGAVRIPKLKPRKPRRSNPKEPGPSRRLPRDEDGMRKAADWMKAKHRIRELKKEIKRLEKLQAAAEEKQDAANELWKAKKAEARGAPFYCNTPWETTTSKKPGEGQGRGRSRGDRHYPRYDQPKN